MNSIFTKLELESARYPSRLVELLGTKAPQSLDVWGNLELLTYPSIGFSGSRNVSEHGLKVVSHVAKQCVDVGWVVVSGHAKGVDTTAHLTALENGGSTIIVIAEGIETFKLRQELKQVATPNNILIVSEFPCRAKWNVGYAMQRNKTILALSDALLIVEPRIEGGTFDAGQQALRYKVPLFLSEYETIVASNDSGSSYFLANGAKVLHNHSETQLPSISQLKRILDADDSEEILQKQLSLFDI
ncbi:MAG: DNA-processing protein DprA [bacterium]|nr:DNA-processing protein DprA [bacterium]